MTVSVVLPTYNRGPVVEAALASVLQQTFRQFEVIVADDGTKDLFVHHTQIVGEGFKSLSEGQRVQFQPREGTKGPEATQVVAVEG